jgi:UDP-3-O-[3-hydroxymyristoyl] glucosamine N-acyltransferase
MENQPQNKKQYRISELAEKIGGTVGGNPDFLITAPAQAGSANPNGLAFAESEKFLAEAIQSAVGAVIVPEATSDFPKPHIKHPHPRQAFGHLLHLFQTPLALEPGIHPTAIISALAKIAPSASVGAYVVVSDRADIASDAKLYPFAYIGQDCTVGERSSVLPHAVLLRNVTLGTGCTVGPGSVLGHAGFGYYFDGDKQVPIPQIGGVFIGEGVEIGALSAVDRATADDTLLGDHVKIDNLVQVAHNVQIGKNSILTSQVGVAGSTTLGERVVAGGQSGFSDHIRVADGVMIGGGSAVLGNIDETGVYTGYPAMPMSQFRRVAAIQKDLPSLLKRLRALEKRVEELENP